MDFLLSRGMRKLPKIPDKGKSYSFLSKKHSITESTSTLKNDNDEKKIRFIIVSLFNGLRVTKIYN